MKAPSTFTTTLLAVVGLVGAALVWLHGEPERALAARERAWGTRIVAGDVLFQDLDCGLRCELIRQVTDSRYVHVGLVLEEGGERVVWEAFHPVGPTPLAQWLLRGRGAKAALYRFEPGLRAALPEIAREVRAMRGLPYDGDYTWDDGRIYCSELIAKGVERATARVVDELADE